MTKTELQKEAHAIPGSSRMETVIYIDAFPIRDQIPLPGDVFKVVDGHALSDTRTWMGVKEPSIPSYYWTGAIDSAEAILRGGEQICKDALFPETFTIWSERNASIVAASGIVQVVSYGTASAFPRELCENAVAITVPESSPTTPPIAKIIGMDALGIMHEVEPDVVKRVTASVATACRLVVRVIREEMGRGLAAQQVNVKELVDHDAGLWWEIVFDVRVQMQAKEANLAWDRMIDRIGDLRHAASPGVARILGEHVGLHLRWH